MCHCGMPVGYSGQFYIVCQMSGDYELCNLTGIQ